MLFAISDKLKVRQFYFTEVISFKDEFKADVSSSETYDSEVLNFES